jgi:glycosyltransferase involved in cell wall biosynthesis
MSKLTVYITVTNDLHQEQRMKRIASTLLAEGYEVCLVGRKLPHSKALPPEYYKQIRLQCMFTKGVMAYVEINLRMIAFLLFKKVDHLISVDLDTILVGRVLRFVKQFKWVYDAHEYFTEVPELLRRPTKKALWEKVGQWCIPKVDLALSVGPKLADELCRKYSRAFEVVRNVPVIVESKSVRSYRHSKPYLLYQGIVNEGRGLEPLIEAMPHIKDLDLIIIGDGDVIGRVKKLAVQSSAAERIQILGWKPYAELATFASGAFLGMNLLDGKSLNYRYSLANKTYDYIMAGLPCVHMNFPEYRDLIERYQVGYVIDTLSPSVIAEKINSILLDPKDHQMRKQHCQRAAEELNWEKESKSLMEVWHKS